MPLSFPLLHLDRRSFLLALLALAVAVVVTLDAVSPVMALTSGLGSFLILAAARCRDAGLPGTTAFRMLNPGASLPLGIALFRLPSVARG